MHPTPRKASETKTRNETKDEGRKEEKPKRKTHTISTPRDFVQKSSTADIYAQKKSVNAPKKAGTTHTTSNISPMKGLLKSSASSVSQTSLKKTESVRPEKNPVRKTETLKKPLTNVTVNSPITRRKSDLNSEPINVATRKKDSSRDDKKEVRRETTKEFRNEPTKEAKGSMKEVTESMKAIGKERQRTNTRTLNESEVKILTPAAVDNNVEMLNLSQKLSAKPKSFYIHLDEDKPTSKPKQETKSSDEDVSYEDDFESYESDFESYHSEKSDINETNEKNGTSENGESSENCEPGEPKEAALVDNGSFREGHEEKMLDSGNFELRDRSAKSKPEVMDFILESVEDRKTTSLTDEGFQDMSSASASSSMKTVYVDRPTFLDFSKAKENKLKRKIHERLKQRANDLLSMITLHEMSYSLFEMQPISYDLYMATYGRSNYTQSGLQTFDDGITQEVQTDEVEVSQKWTQHPVEFSKNDVYLAKDVKTRKYSKHTEDFLTKFTILMRPDEELTDNKNHIDDGYKTNPLRVYFEQKDGVGGDVMLPYEKYKTKLKSTSYNPIKLRKFLRKCESSVSQILNKNTGHKEASNLDKRTKLPFSKGFVSLSSKMLDNDKLSFLKFTKIAQIIFSETKPNLILTIHKNAQSTEARKSLICLWDLSVANVEPSRILTAVDEVTVGKFRGGTDGVVVAALEDGSIHLWDLSEEPTWRTDVGSEQKHRQLIEIGTEKLTQSEKNREWNSQNRDVGLDKSLSMSLQSCAYTNSAYNMSNKCRVDAIVGLEINVDGNTDEGRRVIGQIVSLQRIGVLTIWSIIQEKSKSLDIGKAFASKIKLEKCQTIQLADHIDDSRGSHENIISFNLNSAKRRIMLRKQEKNVLTKKQQASRPQSAISKFDFDIDRPSSAASLRKRVLPADIIVPKSWETGIVCSDIKIMRLNNVNSYLVAKNCGEVLVCKRCLGAVKVNRFSVTNDTSSVTSIEVSTQGLPYFLAATDSGTVNLCSLLDNRVLLTLNCRNLPSNDVTKDKCLSDHKGRYISSSSRRPSVDVDKPLTNLQVRSIHWCALNPCRVYVTLHDSSLILFELTHSDIYAKYACENAAVRCSVNDVHMALLTPQGEVQVHRLSNESHTKDYLDVFQKYAALL